MLGPAFILTWNSTLDSLLLFNLQLPLPKRVFGAWQNEPSRRSHWRPAKTERKYATSSSERSLPGARR